MPDYELFKNETGGLHAEEMFLDNGALQSKLQNLKEPSKIELYVTNPPCSDSWTVPKNNHVCADKLTEFVSNTNIETQVTITFVHAYFILSEQTKPAYVQGVVNLYHALEGRLAVLDLRSLYESFRITEAVFTNLLNEMNIPDEEKGLAFDGLDQRQIRFQNLIDSFVVSNEV